MTDLASERDSAIELVIAEYRRLSRLDPGNRLLAYIDNVNDDGFRYSIDDATKRKFVAKYDSDVDKTPTAVMLARYFLDLKHAADEIEAARRQG